jgi:hypothetical protein
MSAPAIWRIESGVLAFTDVDPDAVGYLASWVAPGGGTAATVDYADYETDSTFWGCQITSGALTPSADSTTQDLPSTFCQLGETLPTPKLSTWTLDVEMIQDSHITTGVGPAQTMSLAEYLFTHDAVEVYYMLGLDAANKAPRAVGRVVLSAATFGGVAQEILLATGSWPTSGKPDIEFGNSTITPTGLRVQTAKADKAEKVSA